MSGNGFPLLLDCLAPRVSPATSALSLQYPALLFLNPYKRKKSRVGLIINRVDAAKLRIHYLHQVHQAKIFFCKSSSSLNKTSTLHKNVLDDWRSILPSPSASRPNIQLASTPKQKAVRWGPHMCIRKANFPCSYDHEASTFLNV